MKASMISTLALAAFTNAAYNVSTSAAEYSTSTVYATSVYTITSCAATVTDCPARIGQVTTDIVSLYTTICPVTAAEGTATYPANTPAAPYPTAAGYPVVSSYPVVASGYPVTPVVSSAPAPILSTITISTCVPSSYTTVITVTPSLASTSAYVVQPTGTGAVSYPTTVPFTGGASEMKVGGLMMVVGLAAALL